MNTQPKVELSIKHGTTAKQKVELRKDHGEMFIGYPGRDIDMPAKESGPNGDLTSACGYLGALVWALNWAAGIEKANWNGIKYDKPRRVLFVTPMEVDDKEILQAACLSEDMLVPVEKLVIAKRNTKIITCALQGKEFCAYLSRMIDLIRPQNLIISPVDYYFRGRTKRAKERIIGEGGWGTDLQKPRGPFDWQFKDEDSDYDAGDWWKR